MAYWVKIIYERDTYVIDLERISAFCWAPNGTLTFWLPDGGTAIFIHPQSNPEAYNTVLDYIKKATGHSLGASWVKIVFERNEYVIDLNRVSAFSCTPGSSKIAFWLPDSNIRIIIHPQSNPEDYCKVIEYIKKKTGHALG